MNILIIEDNKDILDLLKEIFPNAHFCSLIKEIPKNKQFDLIVADRMLPDGDFLDHIDRYKKNTPVIMMSSMSEEEDVINAIKHNVEVFLPKPFSFNMLMEYVDQFKRKQINILEIKGFKIDRRENSVTIREEKIKLSMNEMKILEFFLKSDSQILSRNELLSIIGKSSKSRALDMQITKLRKKMKHVEIKTVHGVGYQLVS